MKLLIRTITLGALMFFMTIIVLHCTMVEVSKQELDVASVNALYRTIDAYEENQKLIAQGDTSNLYFVTDQDYYYYYYDSLMVQLNGKIKVIIICNEANVENGDLDIDITIQFKGVGSKTREHTVHVDTYGKISESVNYTEEQKVMNRKLGSAKVGQKINWANHKWILVSDNNDTTTLLLDENLSSIEFGSDEEYKNSNLEAKLTDFGNNILGKTNLEYLEEATLDGMDTFNGVHTYNGTDEISGKVFALSAKQALKLSKSGYAGTFWLRTSSGTNKVYAYKANVENTTDFTETDVKSSLTLKPAVNIVKSKFSSLTEEADGSYTLNTDDSKTTWELNAVSNVGWEDRNDEILAAINELGEGTYKLSAIVTLTDISKASAGDQYGIKLNDDLTTYSYNQVIINNPSYLEMTFTVENPGSYSDLRLYGCGNSISTATGLADFTNIKIVKLY